MFAMKLGLKTCRIFRTHLKRSTDTRQQRWQEDRKLVLVKTLADPENARIKTIKMYWHKKRLTTINPLELIFVYIKS